MVGFKDEMVVENRFVVIGISKTFYHGLSFSEASIFGGYFLCSALIAYLICYNVGIQKLKPSLSISERIVSVR